MSERVTPPVQLFAVRLQSVFHRRLNFVTSFHEDPFVLRNVIVVLPTFYRFVLGGE